MLLLVFAFLTLTIVVQSQTNTLCSPEKYPPKDEAEAPPLKETLLLPKSYFVAGVLTDWIANRTVLIDETLWETGAASFIHLQNKTINWQWMKDGDKHYFINKTANTCSANEPFRPIPYGFSERVQKLINSDGSSLASIVKGIVTFSKSTKGYYINEGQFPVVAGLEGVHWLVCLNGTNANESSILVEVLFSGEYVDTPGVNISREIILSLRIAEFNGNFTVNGTYNPFNYNYIEFDRISLPQKKEAVHVITPGLTCSGMKSVAFPAKPIDEFYGLINDLIKGTTTQVFYSTLNQVLIETSSTQPFPFINETSKDAATIVHHFIHGYEFSFSPSNCLSMTTLQNTTRDITVDDKGVHLKPFIHMLLNVSINFAAYGTVEIDEGVSVDVYKGNDISGDTIELYLNKDSLLAVRRLSNGSLVSDQRLIYLPSSSYSISQLNTELRSCYQLPDASSHVDTFMVELPGKQLSDISSIGIESFTDSFAQSLASIAYISPLRVSVFPSFKAKDSLDLMFSIAEKTAVQPAPVGTNFSSEVVSAAFIESFNKTLAGGDFNFDVKTPKGEKQTWKVSSKSLSRFPDTAVNPKKFGYTGGSMFVLGIFAFVIGAAIGAGGVIFMHRRKHISTLAYQVFE